MSGNLVLGMQKDEDERWMQAALQLASTGQGAVEPNPMVGCVIVNSNREKIGEGFHQCFGESHAERNAIANCIERGNGAELAGCTFYVTLEPCCHQGKTPPCTDAIIEAKARRVVVAVSDPFPQVNGGGLNELDGAGIEITTGVLETQARSLNAPFFRVQETGLPWVIAKWAMTIDGRIATKDGASKWISCSQSRERVQVLRGRVDAVVVGIGTALADDPRLTARCEAPLRTALRVVMDAEARLPLDSALVKTACEVPTLVMATEEADASRVAHLRSAGVGVHISQERIREDRLCEQLRYLVAERQVTNLLCEGGGKLLGSLNDADLIDEAHIFIAPKLMGGAGALSPVLGSGSGEMAECREFTLESREKLQEDSLLVLRRKRVQSSSL